jgi:antitoxin ChpS
MSLATLRRSGGSLIVTIPSVFAEQNHLSAGDSVAVEINGPCMTLQAVKPKREKLDLAELVAATPAELWAPVWDDVQPEGLEVW